MGIRGLGSPLIGFTGARIRASRVEQMPDTLHGDALDLYHAPYSNAIVEAGGIPVQLPREADPGELVRRLDAVVIAGGEDVNPRLYGSKPGVHSTRLDPDRDNFEVALTERALEMGIPVLGICRGCQLLNVARGGTLIEHLPLGVGESHGLLGYPMHARVHGLNMTDDDLLPGIFARDVVVNSFHHQAVDEPGDGVVPVAYAPDGICEAIRVGPHGLGVQWHPEYHREQPDPIFLWLVDTARHAAKRTTSMEGVDVAAA
jgi:putative glutamine amidotransferase